jgi:hypothetical protein
MGVHISAYAVDLPRFGAFLETPMSELMCRYARDGRDPNLYTFYVRDAQTRATLHVLSDRSIVGPDGMRSREGPAVLSRAQLEAAPFLQRPTRELLSENAYQASVILRTFSHCAGIDFIQPLLWHRRWWIGSVLQAAHARLDQTRAGELELLFRKLLRGFDCGYPIPKGDIGVNGAGLPFTPENNPDLRLGRWDEPDSFTAMEHLSLLLATEPTFTPPADLAFDPGDFDWNAMVWDNVKPLARLWDLGYGECNVLSFIG